VGLQTDERHRRVSFNRSTILFGQHLGDMFCLYRNAFPVERPLYIHQASHVGGHHRIGPGVLDMSDFVFHHGRGNDRVLHCKTAAEAAAIVGIDHFYKFNAPNLVEKLPGLMLDSQAPEQMAGVVVQPDRVLWPRRLRHPADPPGTRKIRRSVPPPPLLGGA